MIGGCQPDADSALPETKLPVAIDVELLDVVEALFLLSQPDHHWV